jgi:uncharacterized membrane protein (DUF4010 family)
VWRGARAIQLDPTILKILVALGVGLIVGAERERRKGEGPTRGAAGIRTFALVALAGVVARLFGGDIMLATATIAVAALSMASYQRQREEDPGLTTEVALIVTVLLGGLAAVNPPLAAGIGVIVAIILAARASMHRFIGSMLTEQELRDGLIFAAVTLVVWPLLPDAAVGPFGALNLHAVWLVVILTMAIGAFGHLASRIVGARFGLPVAGLASGFISSAMTIGAMGAKAARNPLVLSAAVAGAVLSTVATIIQLGVLTAAVEPRVTQALAGSLVCGGLAAIAYAIYFMVAALKSPNEDGEQAGRAFSLSAALTFAAVLCVVLVGSAALAHWFGGAGVFAGAALAGFVDAHAASVSIAALVAEGKLPLDQAPTPILAALTTNTITKIALALSGGDRRFMLRVAPGLVLVAAAAWVGLLVTPLFAGLFHIS